MKRLSEEQELELQYLTNRLRALRAELTETRSNDDVVYHALSSAISQITRAIKHLRRQAPGA